MPISEYLRELRSHVGSALLIMPAVTAIIHDEHGRVLMVYTSDEMWGTPGGSIDPGETAAEAVVREIREELGIEIEPVVLLAVYRAPIDYPNGDRVDYTAVALRCRIISGEPVPADGEVSRWDWFDPAEVVALGIPIPEHVLHVDYEGPAAF